MSAPFPLPTDGNAEAARALHARRALERALHHGAALLDALDVAPLAQIGTLAEALHQGVMLLDTLDGDADDEPWLGYTVSGMGLADTTDREAEPEHDEDEGIGEPSLASPERHPFVHSGSSPYFEPGIGECRRLRNYESQASWACGSREDREAVDEDGPIDEDELDGGDEVDREASLGWTEDFTATVRPDDVFYAYSDRELDEADFEPEQDDDPGVLPWWERSAHKPVGAGDHG